MAISAQLVAAGHNRLRYLVTATPDVIPEPPAQPNVNATLTLTISGAASPDVLADSLIGPLKPIARAVAQGYGKLAAGAKTQAQARALWLSGDASLIGTVPTAICTCTLREPGTFMLDADIDGDGNPVITLNLAQNAALSVTAYLDVYVPNVIGF